MLLRVTRFEGYGRILNEDSTWRGQTFVWTELAAVDEVMNLQVR